MATLRKCFEVLQEDVSVVRLWAPYARKVLVCQYVPRGKDAKMVQTEPLHPYLA